jgi:hypothetical protein
MMTTVKNNELDLDIDPTGSINFNLKGTTPDQTNPPKDEPDQPSTGSIVLFGIDF